MSERQFNQLFDRVRRYGSVEFTNKYGDEMILSLFNGWFCLEVRNGSVLNTVYTHWNQGCFKPILCDIRR